MSSTIAKPLSESDIDKARQLVYQLPADKQDQVNQLFRDYSNLVMTILSHAEATTADEEDKVEIDRLRRILGFCPIEEQFFRTKDKVWNVRHHILNRNAKYFLDRDYSSMIKKDGNQAMIETLVDIVKSKFDEMSTSEQDFYWRHAIQLLLKVTEFMKITEAL